MTRSARTFSFFAIVAGAILLVPAPARGAVTTLDAWTNLLTNTNPGTISYTTTTASTFTMSAGSSRVALVGVCIEVSNSATTISAIDVRLDSSTGTPFTQVVASTLSQREHCYLGRLLDSQVPAGTHPVYLNVSLAANTITGVHIWAGTYQGVDQTTPVSGSAANNSAATTVTFGSAVSYNANSMTAYIVAGGNTATGVAHVSGFASAGQSWQADQSTSIAQATNATSGSWAATSTVTWTNTSGRSAIAVASLNPATVSPPGAPGTPTYTSVASTSLIVNWTAATGATSYNLQRDTSNTFPAPTTINGVTSPYADAGPLNPNTTYWYRVVAVNAGGSTTGTGSSILTLPGAPGAPTFGSIAQTTLTVSWTAPGGGAASYNLQRATDSAFTLNLVTVNGVTSPFSASGLTANTTYWFRVVAVNASGATTGASSSVTTLPNAPGAPGTPTYSSVTQTTLTATWTAATGATSYNLQRATDGAFTLNLTTFTGVTSPYADVGPLTPSTTYWYRAVAVNAGGSTTGAGSSVTTLAPENRAIPGVPSAAAPLCTQVNVSAPFTGDFNGNSSVAFARGATGSGPFTAVTGCGAVTGPSPRTCVDTTAAATTTYFYQVTFTDADGIVGTNPQVTSSVTTPACAALNTTAGTVSALVSSCSQLTVSAPFTGDGNANGSVAVEFNTTNTWPGTAACTVSGSSPRTCLVTNLAASTAYYVRATYADADGVLGVNPQVLGPLTTPACAGNGAPPMILFLSPSRNATVGGTETFKVQVYAPNGIAPANIVYSVDAGATAPVTANANYSCGASCAVYQFTVATTSLTKGSHYATVKATDNSAFAAQVSQPFLVSNSGTVAAGSGHVLRRTSGSQLCLDCHAIATHSSQATSFSYGNWGLECSTCHTPHGTTNIYLVKPTIETPNSGSRSVTFQSTAGVATNSFGTPQASGSGVNVCEVCHTKTKNADASPRARNSAATDWTKHYTGSCTGCHPHGKGFAAGESEGGATCSGCHKSIWDGMTGAVARTTKHTLGNVLGTNDGFGDTAVTWGNPLSANAAAARSCVNMCHNDHPHTLTSPVTNTHENNVYMDAASQASRTAAVRTNADKDKTDFEGGQANGGLCASCHKNPVDASHPAVLPASYAASAHNTTSTTPGGAWQFSLHDASNFNRNCTKCHWDAADGTTPAISGKTGIGAVHSSPNPSLLMGTTNPAGAPASFICYRCHGGGATGADYSSKAVYQDGSKAVKHPVDADSVHASVTEFTNAAWGNTLGVTGRHSNCQDCHDPHEARPSAPNPAQVTAGTATATNGGTAVTGTGTAWTATQVGWRIRNNTLGVWHTVTAVGSATSITISPGATAAWSGAYTLETKAHFYNIGTATFTLNSTAVTGTGTAWTSAWAGSYIRSTTNTLYQIASVNSATSLTLTANYATATLTSTYVIAAGNTAGPGLQGAWGAQLSTNPALWTAPASGNFTKKTIVAGTDLEATLCFKCHTSWYWGAGAPPNGLSANGTATTPVETDVAMEFNPNNRSGHPVLASLNNFAGSPAPKALAAAQMLPPWNAALGTQTMTCSDCHNTDAATPAAQGPHGSAASFMLKNGAAKPGWPTASATAAGFATTICSDCHVNANIHTRDGGHAACYLCHIVVPHGGKMSRLIGDRDAASAMPARYAYNNDKNTMNVQSFTKAASDSGYQTSNCQASCTGTHGTAATENW